MRQPSQRETKVFEALCGPVTAADLAALRAAVQRHKRDLDQASRESEFLATDLAEELADKLDDLLETLPSLLEDVRPLVAGAARYFVSDDDALPDRSGPTGLDDDVAVFNMVARRIGRADLEIAG